LIPRVVDMRPVGRREGRGQSPGPRVLTISLCCTFLPSAIIILRGILFCWVETVVECQLLERVDLVYKNVNAI
jgi:hypothetical protein